MSAAAAASGSSNDSCGRGQGGSSSPADSVVTSFSDGTAGASKGWVGRYHSVEEEKRRSDGEF